MAFYGLMDANTSNPFGDWNFVWLPYCDGSSQTSARETSVEYNGTQVWFRGAAIIDAMLFDLEQQHGFLSTAEEVIVSGTSAGGMGTFLHAGYFKSQLANASARVVAVPDAGFWLDHAYYHRPGQPSPWYETLQTATSPQLWNSSLRGGAGRCASDLGPKGLATRCLFPQYLYRGGYMDDVDGVFVLQSTYDVANLDICVGISSSWGNITTCNATVRAAIDAYASDLRSNVTGAISAAGYDQRDGYFITSCYQHEESCQIFDWYGITIGGQTPNATFYEWYTTSGANPLAKRVDGPWPSDATCAPAGVKHGSC